MTIACSAVLKRKILVLWTFLFAFCISFLGFSLVVCLVYCTCVCVLYYLLFIVKHLLVFFDLFFKLLALSYIYFRAFQRLVLQILLMLNLQMMWCTFFFVLCIYFLDFFFIVVLVSCACAAHLILLLSFFTFFVEHFFLCVWALVCSDFFFTLLALFIFVFNAVHLRAFQMYILILVKRLWLWTLRAELAVTRKFPRIGIVLVGMLCILRTELTSTKKCTRISRIGFARRLYVLRAVLAVTRKFPRIGIRIRRLLLFTLRAELAVANKYPRIRSVCSSVISNARRKLAVFFWCRIFNIVIHAFCRANNAMLTYVWMLTLPCRMFIVDMHKRYLSPVIKFMYTVLVITVVLIVDRVYLIYTIFVTPVVLVVGRVYRMHIIRVFRKTHIILARMHRRCIARARRAIIWMCFRSVSSIAVTRTRHIIESAQIAMYFSYIMGTLLDDAYLKRFLNRPFADVECHSNMYYTNKMRTLRELLSRHVPLNTPFFIYAGIVRIIDPAFQFNILVKLEHFEDGYYGTRIEAIYAHIKLLNIIVDTFIIYGQHKDPYVIEMREHIIACRRVYEQFPLTPILLE